MTSIIYKTPPEAKYTEFTVPKKSGGERTIKAPNPKLKRLQSHLAQVLYLCLDEIEKSRDVKPVSYGFRKNGTTLANAKNHKNRRYVLNLDLEDFFPTFNFGRVRGFFLKDKSFELNEEVATTIAQIACDGKALPQGSPCSPVISELIGQIIDLRLLRFAKKHKVRYSRYADDITFSTNQKHFPEALAKQATKGLSSWEIGKPLVEKIENSGFKINKKKTRMHCRGSRQMVNGLVVNIKVNIRSEYYRKARAMCDSIFQTGKYYNTLEPSKIPGGMPTPMFKTNRKPLEGILSHIYNVTQSEERRPVTDQRIKPRAIRSLYRRFLFYKYCAAPDTPLIITEGKTDQVYLKEAIKRRAAYHAKLGNLGKDGFDFAVRFFNYEGQAHEIMDLSGGSGDLKSVPLDYLRNFDSKSRKRKPMTHKPMAHPVILLVDNDDGLSSIAGTIKTNFGKSIKISSKEPFYHITENLYLVKTPEIGHKSCIEDLFPHEWLQKTLKGKKFNPASKIDPTTEYSKEVFANSVVKPNAHLINFSGFDPLLNRISSVLDAHKQG